MTTKLSEKTRIPIPSDIQPGDVLVLRDGHRKEWGRWDEYGLSWCDGFHPGGHHPDGRWWNRKTFAPHKWDVVAIERMSQPKKLRPDKDAAWLLKQAEDMSYTATKAFVRRIRAIAKRLNGGVAP